jgi:hypothetical protein
VDQLAPPADLPANAKEIARLWDVNGDPRQARQVSRFPGWEPYQIGEALSVIAAGFLHSREVEHRDPSILQDEDDNLRHGFSHYLSHAHVRHDPRRFDEWGSPFKTRFVQPGSGADSVLAKDYPELFARVCDDETAIIYWPKYRRFGIPVLDGGPSIISISHDPFSGKALPPSVRDEWFATVEKLLGRPYSDPQETPVPDEFTSEAWWIARGL